MTDNIKEFPVPVTSNNWSPIEYFKPNLPYAKDHFLVWLVDDEGQGWFEESWFADGKFDGTWRHVQDDEGNPAAAINALEPIAFKLIEGPNLDDLKRIVEHHGKAA
jgi:hypothetical protein